MCITDKKLKYSWCPIVGMYLNKTMEKISDNYCIKKQKVYALIRS